MRSGQLIYFSPTTPPPVFYKAIAKGLCSPMSVLDITHNPLDIVNPAASAEIVMVGVPVYGGRDKSVGLLATGITQG